MGSGIKLDRRGAGLTAATAPAAPLLGRVRTRLLGGASSLALPMASAALALGVALSGEAVAQTTVNPVQTTTYNINPASNPITFGPTTNIHTTDGFNSNAVYGAAGTPWNVTVQNAARIAGYSNGINLQSQGTVTNTGTITGTSVYGVYVNAGGSVTNQTGGTISGGRNGVYVVGASGTVTNAGSITGSSRYGVHLNAGGSVTNQAGGTISGGRNGVFINAASGTVTNAGTITGTRYHGVYLLAGGSVTNQAGGTISGSYNGVFINNASGTVTNAGTITGTNNYGVRLGSGGSVTNQATGTISGGTIGVFVNGAAGTVINAGTITGTNQDGVILGAGGSVTNLAGGTITDANIGVSIVGGAGTVTNAGTITGTHRFGVSLQAGGGVTNQTGGTITGADVGVIISGGAGTLTNAGIITGAIIASVIFSGTGANVLILQTGSVLSGDAFGSSAGGATSALILQGTGSANNNFVNFNTLDVQAGGVWALNGVSTIGTTTISSGTLAVGDASHPGAALTSPVTVNAGGMLAGQGTVIGNVTVLSGGAIAPGAASPFSTLNVTGNASFATGSLFQVNVNAAGQTDKLALSGTASLTGGAVQAVFAPGSYVSRSYDILHTAGGLGGTTFTGGLTGNVPAGFNQSLSYTTNDVTLNLTAQLGAGSTGGLGGNQSNVANSLNTFFNNGGALPPGFLPLFGLSGGNLGNALGHLSGEAGTGAQQGAFQLMTGFLGLMIDPSTVGGGAGGFGGSGGAIGFAPERTAISDEIALAYASVMKAPVTKAPPAYDQRWNVWGSAFGGGSRTSGNAAVGSSDVTANAAGAAAGIDYRLTRDTLIGFALAGGGTNWSLSQGLGGGRGDAFQAGIYAKTTYGPAYVAASLAAAEHWMSTDRFAFAADHLTASFNAQSYGGRIEGGYRFATSFMGITPYAAAQVQAFHTPGYRETDLTAGGFGLSYAARNATDTRAELGSRFDREQAVSPDAVLTLRGRLAWAHDWVSDPSLSAAFQALPGASFIVNGATPAKDSALASAGAELRWRNGWSLAAKFDGEFASRSQTYAGTGTVRYSW